MEIAGHLGREVVFGYFTLEVAVVLVPPLQLDEVLFGGHQPHVLLLVVLPVPLVLLFLLGQHQQVELAGSHLVPRVLVVHHVFKENVFEVIQIGLIDIDFGVFEVSSEVRS